MAKGSKSIKSQSDLTILLSLFTDTSGSGDLDRPQGSGEVESPLKEFQFINVPTTMHLGEDSKTSIRTQAMRDFHRRKSRQQVSNHNREGASTRISTIEPSIIKQTYKFRLGPWGLQQRPTPPRAPRRKRPVQAVPIRKEESSPGRSIPQLVSRVREGQLTHLQPASRKEEIKKAHHLPASTNILTENSPATEKWKPERTATTASNAKDGTFLRCWEVHPDLSMPETLQYDPGNRPGDPFDAIPFLASRSLQSVLYYCELSTYSHCSPLSIYLTSRFLP
jgi:hypothetical protein